MNTHLITKENFLKILENNVAQFSVYCRSNTCAIEFQHMMIKAGYKYEWNTTDVNEVFVPISKRTYFIKARRQYRDAGDYYQLYWNETTDVDIIYEIQYSSPNIKPFTSQQEIWKHLSDGGKVIHQSTQEVVYFIDGQLLRDYNFCNPEWWMPFYGCDWDTATYPMLVEYKYNDFSKKLIAIEYNKLTHKVKTSEGALYHCRDLKIIDLDTL